jgi:thioredoxin 2
VASFDLVVDFHDAPQSRAAPTGEGPWSTGARCARIMVMSTTVSCPNCGTRNRLPVVAPGRPRCPKCHTDLPWLTPATTEEFDELVAVSPVPVLVDLWAEWCGPCRMVAPILERLSEQRAGSLRVVKVDVDEEPKVSHQLRVQGIPTMVLFDGGAEIARQVGALPEHRLVAWLDDALGERAG